MTYLLIILSILAGSLIKLTDDISDNILSKDRFLEIPSGIAYGFFIGYLMILDIDAAILFGGIVIGCLVTGKINTMGHYLGLSAILVVLFINGIRLTPLVLLTAGLAAIDELGDKIRSDHFHFIFEYRMILKMGILILVILKITGLNALVILLAFDLAYILTGKINERLSHEI